MQGNMQQMMAEAIRQGQAETERRLVMMKALHGGLGGPNPLVDHFRNDPEIGRLQVDIDIMTSLFDKKCTTNPLVLCPLFWPHALILNVPCNYCYARMKLQQVADAHQLTLHEKSLKLKVDPYPSYLQNAQSGQALMMPWCCSCCVADTSPIEEVIPLADVDSVRIEQCQLKQCGSAVAPDTFVVRANGISRTFPLFAVDGPNPEQAEKFIRQVMDQVNTAKETSMHDAPLPQAWAEYQKSLYGGGVGMMGMMGMGMMAGGAPGQMQMNRGAAGHYQAGGQQMNPQMQAMQMQALQMQQMQMSAMATGGGMQQQPQPMGTVIATAEPMPSAPVDDTAAQLAKIDGLKKSGAISEAEYQAMRAKALGL
jgi:hypothetical protein